MSQSRIGVAPKLSLGKNDKPRPTSLELSDDKNSDLALRIVSPGLPALNEEMKSTIKLSQKLNSNKKISLQQDTPIVVVQALRAVTIWR